MKNKIYIVLLVGLAFVAGCGPKEDQSHEIRPRPVTTQVLVKQLPPSAAMLSASVSSWKTEQIGFEVGGRVKWVLEPNKEVEGRQSYQDGEQTLETGTPLAQLETERFEIALEKAKAEKVRASKTLDSARIELNESIKAQIDAAKATRDLADIEYKRSEKLFRQKAGSKGDVDRDYANLQTSIAEVKRLEASLEAKAAEVASLESSLKQAEQELKDAKRNLADCTLFSSFPGQISEVAIVPGSVVDAGTPAVTVQMMDPIKIEMEVSAEQSRRLGRTERVPVFAPPANGAPDSVGKQLVGFLYLIDPIADPLTRTFTVTLLLTNERLGDAEGIENISSTVAFTDDIWRVDFQFLPGVNDHSSCFIESNALVKEQDGDRYYLWKITNSTVNPGDPSKVFKVKKMPVELGPRRIPFLGKFEFQEIKILDPDFDPSLNMVVGRLNFVDETMTPNDWDGDTVLLSRHRWLLRPGDIVKVSLPGLGRVEEGYYIPMDAVGRQGESSFIFAVEENNGQSIAKRIDVQVLDKSNGGGTSSLRQIEPIGDDSLEGIRIVTAGVHYLIDGEPVVATGAAE